MSTIPKYIQQDRPLSNIELDKYARDMKIPYFRGVFMRNDLPVRIGNYESGIINLDSRDGVGTHWTAYKKNQDHISYYDSFGNLKPPREVMKYFKSDGKKCSILYNYDSYQTYNTVNCGHLCLQFLSE